MYNFFIEGGFAPMSILTALLVAIFFAAWKAPRWVKEIGIIALAFSFLMLVLNLNNLFSVLGEVAGDRDETNGLFDLISPYGLFKGLAIYSIKLIYGISIYLVSLVIRMLQKPRL